MRGYLAKCRLPAWPFLVGLVFLAGLSAPETAKAQPYPVPPTWGGDFWSRPRLTGDWGGVRDDLGKKGVVLDVDLLLTPQSVFSGGKSDTTSFWGNTEYTLNLDTQKMGLWPGGFVKLEGNTGFGSNAFSDSGAIVPINTAALYPGNNVRTSALTNATIMQFLSPQFGMMVGKINTVDLGETEFYGNYRTQFENTAFNFPMTILQVPLSTFGAGLIGIPNDDILLSLLVLGPSGTSTDDSWGQAFDGDVLLYASGLFTIRPWGLVGHQSVAFTWNDSERLSLNQDPTNIATYLLQSRFPRLNNPGPVLEGILARFFPGLLVPAKPANREGSSWAVTYSFDQYLWQPDGDPKHGIGLFFAFGASDGNPNPIQYSFFAGLGGKGVVPGRPDDNFGLGFSRTQFSAEFVPLLRQRLGLGLDHEDAIEAYYNAALTQWLNLTLDLQVVDPGLKKMLSPPPPGLLSTVDTAVVGGLRLRVRF